VSQQDKSFFTTFVAIMGFLVVFAFVIYFIAQSVVSDDGTADGNSQLTQIIEENIKPVGKVNVAGATAGGAVLAAGVLAPPAQAQEGPDRREAGDRRTPDLWRRPAAGPVGHPRRRVRPRGAGRVPDLP